MRSRSRVVTVALAATLLIAACGSDDSGSGADVGTPTETIAGVDRTPDTTIETTGAPTSVPDEAQDIEGDTAAAEAALLTVADLPAGWTEAPADGDADAALAASLAACVGVDGDVISAADATATADRFAAPDGTASISQHVGVLAVEGDARTVVAFTAEPAVPACFEAAYAEFAGEALAGELDEGAQFGAPVASRLQVGSAGDATQAIRVTVPVTGDPTTAEVTIDHVVVRNGRSLTTITFASIAAPTTVESIDAVTAVAAERLPA